MYYHIQSGAILSGPHSINSDYVRKLTRCGTPEVLDLSEFGLVPEIREPLGPQQSRGEPIVSADAVTIPAVDWSAEQIAAEREAYLDALQCTRLQGKLALIQAGLWDQYEATIAAMLPTMSPAQRVFVEDAPVWKYRDPVLQALAGALEMTDDQVVTLFETARTL